MFCFLDIKKCHGCLKRTQLHIGKDSLLSIC